MFLLAVGVLGMGALVFLGGRLTQASADRTPEVEPLQELSPTIQAAAKPFETVQAPPTTLTSETAKQLIQTWLAAKAAAMGETHDTSKLSQILTGAALARWQSAADEAKENNAYIRYTHQVNQVTLATEAETATEVEVNAEVVEAAEHFADGEPESSLNYNDTLQVRYVMVRQNDRWLIQEMGAE